MLVKTFYKQGSKNGYEDIKEHFSNSIRIFIDNELSVLCKYKTIRNKFKEYKQLALIFFIKPELGKNFIIDIDKVDWLVFLKDIVENANDNCIMVVE